MSTDDVKLRQRKLGALCWVATVPLRNICARAARIVSGINALCGSAVYRINELVRVVKEWQRATAPTYAVALSPVEFTGAGRTDSRGP